MTSRALTTSAAAAFLLVLSQAAPARAEAILTPFIGVVFGGNIEDADDLFDTNRKHRTFGGNLAFLGDGPVGFEVDFGYSPDFFGDEESGIPQNNLTTLMGNLVFSGKLAGDHRIYVSAGGGVLKSRIDDTDDFFDVSATDFAANAGAGVIVALGDMFGVRGDIRYFRRIGDPEPDGEFDVDFGEFNFWRATAGVSLRF